MEHLKDENKLQVDEKNKNWKVEKIFWNEQHRKLYNYSL